MKAKLFMLVLAVLLVAGLAGGATMAWFTDQTTNAATTFTAGTVDITADRDLGDPIPGPMFYTTVDEGLMPGQDPDDLANVTGVWWPGQTVTRNLDVRNIGSLSLRLHQVSAEITHINGVSPPDPGLAAAFAAQMHVRISVAAQPAQVLYDGPLATLLLGPQAAVFRPSIAPGGMQQLAYQVTMLTSAGNDLQGIVPVVSFSVFAEQTKNN